MHSEKRTVAAFDLDGTLIPFDAFIPFLCYSKGTMRTVANLITLVPQIVLYFLGLRSRQEVKESVLLRLVKGDSMELLVGRGEMYAQEKVKPRLKRQMMEKVDWHKRQGHRLVLVSANINPIVEPIKEMLGFDDVLASNLEIDQWGVVTGYLEGENCRGHEKVERLKRLLGEKENYLLYAYGDSAGDKEMLEMADHPFKV